MPIVRPEALRALVNRRDPQPQTEERRVPYPTPADVLYEGPNPDGSRKTCGNCWKYVIDGRCLEVAGDINVGMVCGSHVFGKAQSTDLAAYTLAGDQAGALPVRKMTAAEAGLVTTPNGDGTSCDLCRFYEEDPNDPEGGLCSAVGAPDGYPPVVVDAKGCCSRWEIASVK